MAIIQARMGSNRLPGKIMMPLPFGSKLPLISWPIQTLKKISSIERIVLATSSDKSNLPLADLAKKYNIDFIAGSEDDVLSRFIEAINICNPQIVVRITGDNPILDSTIIEKVIEHHIDHNSDYTYSIGMPLGMNVEVVNADALITINKKSLSAADREHVTLFFKSNNDFKISKFSISGSENLLNTRLTVDYPSDYATMNLVATISLQTGYEGLALVEFIRSNYPWIWEINHLSHQNKHYSSQNEEMKEAVMLLEKYQMYASEKLIQKEINLTNI